jgi:hypothetical protein
MRSTTDLLARASAACRRSRVAGAAALLLACGGAVAHAGTVKPPPVDPCATAINNNSIAAVATKPGTIDLVFYNAHGARVVFYECLRGGPKRLGARLAADASSPTSFRDAATWSCDRLSRRFGAVATLPDGTLAFGAYSVHTPSCATRFELRAPRRMKPGAKASVRVSDRWGIGGIHTELCIGPVGGRPRCRLLAFPRAVALVSRRFRATERGRWRVELRVRGERIRTAIVVGEGGRAAKPLPIVLAAGDSTMQGIDSFLADELAGVAYVRSDVRPGTGISRGVYWEFHARSQTKRLRQRVTVMSVGAASDGLPIPNAIGVLSECCDAPWIEQYANRVRGVMQTFLREGRGRVVWLTPPEPRWEPRAKITHAVNVAVELAAAGLRGIKVLRIDRMFSPDGVYRDVIAYRGRQVRVRESDGVHLNVAGTAIAARAVVQAIGELG